MIKDRKPIGDTSSRRPVVSSAAAAIRRMKAGRRTGSTNSASIFLSCAALVVSMGSVGVGILQTNAAHSQVQIAEQQNRELRDQFVQAGPIVTVSSSLQFEEQLPDGTVNSILSDSSVVSAAMIDGYYQVFFNIELENAGRSATTIQSVDFITGPNDYISARLDYAPYIVYCGTAQQRSQNCVDELPYSLDPGKVYGVFFFIYPELHKAMIDNGAGSKGLEVRIYAVGIQQQPLQYVSHIRFSK